MREKGAAFKVAFYCIYKTPKSYRYRLADFKDFNNYPSAPHSLRYSTNSHVSRETSKGET